MDFREILLLTLAISLASSTPVKTAYKITNCNSCHPTVDGKINVHLVPHSHDDVGWLKTVDQYYFGSGIHDSYADAGVQYIISSAVQALKSNPERRFIQVETGFFSKWWADQSDLVKQDVIDLVNSGHLEIVNAAWSMNDEAAAHYHSIVDQFTWGLKMIDDALGSCGRPKIGWQIDPFGHSREHASLMTQLGFQGLVIGRLDYRDKAKRIADKNLDFIWQTSANLENSKIFTTMFPDFYGSPAGYCFDIVCSDSPINDDENSPGYNLKEKVDGFIALLDKYAAYYQTSNIMIPMGGDFNYQAAEINFLNLDRLIKGLENHEKYNVIYSTPSCYIEAVNAEVNKNQIKLVEKTDDFFPYASDAHSFWTGYFTSRPTSKRFERMGNNILQAVKQLTALSRSNTDASSDSLREAMGIMQHHDAITGTEKQAVANDYARLLTKAIGKAEEPISNIIGNLLKKDADAEFDLKLSSCLLANVSICENSQKDRFVVSVYNPLARAVTHYVRLPVEGDSYKVTGPDGDEINDVLNSISSFDYIENATPSPKELVFAARNLPPFGIKVYYVEKTAEKLSKPTNTRADDNTFGTETNGFTIDPTSHLLSSVTINGVKLEISQEFLYYLGESGNNFEPATRSSGAYIFRPVEQEAKKMSEEAVTVTSTKGQLVDEVVQVINPEVTQIIRSYKGEGDAFIEFDWLVGDLQKTDKGKEVITRFTVKDFNNAGVFYTDSNGREQLRRELNKRSDYEYDSTEEPVSSNYYPVTSRIVIQDEDKQLEVAVLNDRAQGGSSLTNGAIELMVHRILVHDDGFGVGETLNEQQFGKGLYARGQHLLTFGPSSATNEDRKSTRAFERDLAHRKLLAPWILVADATGENFDTVEEVQALIEFKYEGLRASLADNVHILTFEPWQDDTFILRLEHVLEKDEDEMLSQPADIDLTTLFKHFDVIAAEEVTLAANQYLADYEAEEKLVWEQNEEPEATGVKAGGPLQIQLGPMEIRSFIIRVKEPESDPDAGSGIKPVLILLILFSGLLVFLN